MEGFGENLIIAREKKGLSQRKLAELLEITPTRLNYWEKNKREPDLYMFKKIVNVLDVDPNELLGLKHIAEQSNKYCQLNSLGKKKADEYIEDLFENSKYTEQIGTQQTISDDITNDIMQTASHPINTK